MDGDANDGSAVRAFLERLPVFERLPRGLLRLLTEAVEPRTYDPGELLIHQGALGDSMFILTRGHARVVLRRDKRADRTLDEVGPGTVLGEMALLTSEPRSADVIASDDVEALVLTAADFRRLRARYPDFAVVLTHLVADRLGQGPVDGLGDKVLEGYRLRRRLGLGSTAVVYEAVHEESGRRVALKMLSHRFALDPAAVARFEREMKILQRLDHPLVARVYEDFERFGTRFMAMEFYRGRDLRRVLHEEGPLPEACVRAVAGQLARVLQHVHAHGVVHKDVKPANVMILGDGWARLMDFGISKPPPTLGARDDNLIAGTPAYMAPEQFMGPASDATIDVYALGCVLYELLVGEVPVEGDSLREVLRCKRESDFRPLTEARPDLGFDLTHLVETCLHAEPRRRRVNLYDVATWAAPMPT